MKEHSACTHNHTSSHISHSDRKFCRGQFHRGQFRREQFYLDHHPEIDLFATFQMILSKEKKIFLDTQNFQRKLIIFIHLILIKKIVFCSKSTETSKKSISNCSRRNCLRRNWLAAKLSCGETVCGETARGETVRGETVRGETS